MSDSETCDGGDCGHPCTKCGSEYGGACSGTGDGSQCPDGERRCNCKRADPLDGRRETAFTPPKPRKDWIQSYSSKVVTPRDLKPDQVSFADIAHALAQKVRFNGQLSALGYSVAQHCVMGAEQIAGPFKLAFLLHEVSEVYLPDIPAPLKPFVHVEVESGRKVNASPPGFPPTMRAELVNISWSDLESLHADAIFTALNLTSIRPLIDTPEVRSMDLRMLMTEKRDLASPEPMPWGIDAEPLPKVITGCWLPTQAEQCFLNLFDALSR